ncbi:hypothetical protein BC938DRAFT_482849 [Jimgerdemannia flammicorona]|uniref:HIT domain-containing protein n=1 Tax=Jimgerdemannia flammicorona TaxID=994334 RepID=A0A433QD29_9FUNG|nr:hypothetical protein BC938DRAFT_482849 [Jimgerdemannia flammicorona]
MKTHLFGPHVVRESEVFYHSKLCIGLVNLKPIALRARGTPTGRAKILRSDERRVTGLALNARTGSQVCDLMLSTQKIGRVIEREYNGSSLTIAIQVRHTHVHVIPRRFGDWANNDDIYKELDQVKEASTLHDVDNEGRKPRSLEEMKEEADRLRVFFEHVYPDE